MADTILERSLEKEDIFYESWPSYVFGEDAYGHVINAEKIADINPDTLQQYFNADTIVEHRTKHMEKLQRAKQRISSRKGYRVYKHIYILDLNGLKMSHFSQTIQKSVKVRYRLHLRTHSATVLFLKM